MSQTHKDAQKYVTLSTICMMEHHVHFYLVIRLEGHHYKLLSSKTQTYLMYKSKGLNVFFPQNTSAYFQHCVNIVWKNLVRNAV